MEPEDFAAAQDFDDSFCFNIGLLAVKDTPFGYAMQPNASDARTNSSWTYGNF